jgi:ADP-dependent NAD(P)H-hydrate dehydratase / NAD(P)H-hydrate epimerase
VPVDATFLRDWVRRPTSEDHKYSRGTLGMVTGSDDFPGAALIGVEAALRTGVGMVRYVGPPSVATMVVTQHPEVVIATGSIDALVVGSGMATPANPESAVRITEAAQHGVPSVVDAGALAHAEKFGPLSVLTPHRGELLALCARLDLATDESDLDTAAIVARELGVAVVVKGSQGGVVNHHGDVWLLPTATPWLATAGTGDALAGIIGALMASWHDELTAQPERVAQVALAGALIHQSAAAGAALRGAGSGSSGLGGPFSVLDLCREIPVVIAETLNQSDS